MSNFEKILNDALRLLLGVTEKGRVEPGWDALPPGWLVFFIFVGLAGLAWLLYRIELGRKRGAVGIVMSLLRFMVIAAVLLMLFEPFVRLKNESERRGVVVMLVDSSRSMGFKDPYDRVPKPISEDLKTAAGLADGKKPSDFTRMELVKRVMKRDNAKLLTDLAEKGRLEWYSFASSTEYSEELGRKPVEILDSILPEGQMTDLGVALEKVLAAYRPSEISAIVLVTDGQHNATTELDDATKAIKDHGIRLIVVGVGETHHPKDAMVEAIIADEEAPVKADLIVKGTVRVNLGTSAEERKSGAAEEKMLLKIYLEVAPTKDDKTPPDNTFKKAADPKFHPITRIRKAAAANNVKKKKGEDEEKGKDISFVFNPEFKVSPEKKGSFVYRIRIELLKEITNPQGQLEMVPVEEGDTKNNRMDHPIRIKDKRLKVLFIDQEPRYEYRYLRSVLVRNTDQFIAWTYLISADDKYKQDHTEGTYNDIAEKEHKIEPLTDLPRLRRVPDSRSNAPALEDINVIILGDVEKRRLHRKGEKVAKFLKDLDLYVKGDKNDPTIGGGALILSVGELYGLQQFMGTPIESLLPVKIEPLTVHQTSQWTGLAKSRRYALTDAGRRSSITRLFDDKDPKMSEAEKSKKNEAFWAGSPSDPYQGLPGFYWFYPIKKTAGVATVLVEHATERIPGNSEKKKYPLIVTGKPGKGLVMFIALDSLWRWRRGVGDRYYQRFWSQALNEMGGVRFLQTKLYMTLKPTTLQYKDPIDIEVTLLDPKIKPVNKGLRIKYQKYGADGQVDAKSKIYEAELAQKPKPNDRVFWAKLVPPEDGHYRIWIDDPAIPTVRTEKMLGLRRFTVELPEKEERDRNMNASFLRKLATDAGDASLFFRLHQLGIPSGSAESVSLAGQVKENVKIEDEDTFTYRPHNNRTLAIIVLILFMLMLIPEWLLRKRKKLI